MKRTLLIIIVSVVSLILLGGCDLFEDDPTGPEDTPVPTRTSTPRVTATPSPTVTPSPTETPESTATPVPTPTPCPDSQVQITSGVDEGRCVFTIYGASTGIGCNGNTIALFVRPTYPYNMNTWFYNGIATVAPNGNWLEGIHLGPDSSRCYSERYEVAAVVFQAGCSFNSTITGDLTNHGCYRGAISMVTIAP